MTQCVDNYKNYWIKCPREAPFWRTVDEVLGWEFLDPPKELPHECFADQSPGDRQEQAILLEGRRTSMRRVVIDGLEFHYLDKPKA